MSHKYLEDVPPDKNFFLGSRHIRNLYGLLLEVRNITDAEFNHYVSKHHNYFSDWIEHVINHKRLANRLRDVTDKEEFAEILQDDLDNLMGKLRVYEEELSEAKSHNRKNEVSYHQYKKGKMKLEDFMKIVAENEEDIKEYLKHYLSGEMRREFLLGLAIGIIVGVIIGKLVVPG